MGRDQLAIDRPASTDFQEGWNMCAVDAVLICVLETQLVIFRAKPLSCRSCLVEVRCRWPFLKLNRWSLELRARVGIYGNDKTLIDGVEKQVTVASHSVWFGAIYSFIVFIAKCYSCLALFVE